MLQIDFLVPKKIIEVWDNIIPKKLYHLINQIMIHNICLKIHKINEKFNTENEVNHKKYHRKYVIIKLIF